MAVFTIKAASRALLRRTHFPSRHQFNPTKRHHSSGNPATRPKPEDDPASGTAIPIPATVANVPLWQRLGPLSRGFQAYGRSQRKRPYATQFCSSLVIYFLGDLSAQNINGDEYDPKRMLRALVISAGSSIPSYKWFMFLGNNFNYSSKILSLVTKVTVNQICFTPIFNTYFFGMQSLLSGDSLSEVWERIKRTVPISMINSCKLWPAVTAFSFTFIDPQYRSIFAGFIAIGWQTYLSYLNRKAEVAEAAERAVNGGSESGGKREVGRKDDTQKIEA
ncbi:hypothetical protein N431DRAFT_422504 [Stipitochalara longipes BDJ]|nr:hypothetical protein N431DRAFT_422504 [Stipitochalara longipes BDJ]